MTEQPPRRNRAEPRPPGLGYTIGRGKPRPHRRPKDLNWYTGEPIPDTLEGWLLVSYRRGTGCVLSAAKVRDAVARLGLA